MGHVTEVAMVRGLYPILILLKSPSSTNRGDRVMVDNRICARPCLVDRSPVAAKGTWMPPASRYSGFVSLVLSYPSFPLFLRRRCSMLCEHLEVNPWFPLLAVLGRVLFKNTYTFQRKLESLDWVVLVSILGETEIIKRS